MVYIWINPVTERMYEPEVLNAFLHHHGYKRFYTTGDWLTIVKEKYRMAIKQTANVVVDMRCPKIKELLEETGCTSKVTTPDIKPILMHCGQECSEREDLAGEEKMITTPCKALADMGNALGLENTCFVPWNQFLERIGESPKGKPPVASPIPPGFFEGLGVKTISVTGEDEIRAYFANEVPEDVRLVEMLFCKDGCHNGDGIRTCEK